MTEVEDGLDGPAAAGVTGSPARRRRRRVGFVVAGAAALVFGSLGGWWLHGRGPDGPTVYYPTIDYSLHPLERPS